jgi:hypothetical protein
MRADQSPRGLASHKKVGCPRWISPKRLAFHKQVGCPGAVLMLINLANEVFW